MLQNLPATNCVSLQIPNVHACITACTILPPMALMTSARMSHMYAPACTKARYRSYRPIDCMDLIWTWKLRMTSSVPTCQTGQT